MGSQILVAFKTAFWFQFGQSSMFYGRASSRPVEFHYLVTLCIYRRHFVYILKQEARKQVSHLFPTGTLVLFVGAVKAFGLYFLVRFGRQLLMTISKPLAQL